MRSRMRMLLLLSAVSNMWQSSGQSFYCSEERSCVNESLYANNGEIVCRGYQSCLNANSLILEGNSYTLNCLGSNSCENSTLIESSHILVCGGLKSCQNVQTIKLIDSHFEDCHCWGESSCRLSTMYVICKHNPNQHFLVLFFVLQLHVSCLCVCLMEIKHKL